MIFKIILFLFFLNPLELINGSPLLTTEEENYLKRYGYMEQIVNTGQSLVESSMSNAIRRFQRMSGLPATGIIENETRRMMQMPRCGVTDVTRKRSARHSQPVKSKWLKKDLTYFFKRYSRNLPVNLAENEVWRALQTWSEATQLNFSKSPDVNSGDIEVSFEVLEHGDKNDFDGPGGILAHAFYPQNGDMHFDDDETWTTNTNIGSNLYQVAVHELGHSLGLEHSNVQDSVMSPFYRGYNPQYKLHSSDVTKIQSLYGESYPRTPYEKSTTQQPQYVTPEHGKGGGVIPGPGPGPVPVPVPGPVPVPVPGKNPRVPKRKSKSKHKSKDSSEEKGRSKKTKKPKKPKTPKPKKPKVQKPKKTHTKKIKHSHHSPKKSSKSKSRKSRN